MGSASPRSGDADGPFRRPTPLSESNHRPAGQHIRYCFGLDIIGFKPVKPDFDVGQYRRRHVFPEPFSGSAGFLGLCHHKGFPHARPCQSLYEISVDGTPDPEREDIGSVQVVTDQMKHLFFSGDIPIAHQEHRSGVPLIPVERERSFQRSV